MTLDGIAKRLDAIDARLGGLDTRLAGLDTKVGGLDTKVGGLDTKVGGLETKLGGLDTKLGGLEAEMRSGFKSIGDELNKAKIRDEELHGLLKFSLEAREGLRESMEQRFDEAAKNQDRELGLLKDVLRHVTGTRASG
jgi:chromosome segregation ATPase